MSTEGVHRKLAAILCADVEGYSRLMQDDPEGTLHTLKDHREVFRRCTEYHEGRIVDSPGDNILIEFASAIEAVQCAVEIQRELAEKNAELADARRMRFRIGIDLGDLLEQDHALYGDGVNISARLQSLAESGGICVSGRAYDQVVNRLPIKFDFLGRRSVKNIDHPIRVYRVLIQPVATGVAIKEKKVSRMVSRRLAMTTIIALIIIAAGSLIWNIYSNQSRKTEQASEPAQAPAIIDVAEAYKTIAVLPFVNLSSDPEQEYFVDGLSEELLNSLAKIPDLSVTSRTSVFTFKGSSKTVQEIANILGVDHILEGSVRKSGDALRITTQLIRAADDRHLWSETYNRQLKDIFAVQEDIAKTVASELKITLGIDDATKKLGSTENEKAYEQYLIAKGYFAPPADKRALKPIDTAIEINPDFALAWSLKARIHQVLALRMPDEQFLEELNKGLHAANKAIELDQNLPDAYSSLGVLESNMGELIDAGKTFRKAIELVTDPLVDAQVFIDSGFHYRFLGFIEKAHKNIESQLRNDPLNSIIRSVYMSTSAIFEVREWSDEEYKHTKLLFKNGIIDKMLFDMLNEEITLYRLLFGDVVLPEEFISIKFWSIPGAISDIYREHFSSPNEAMEKIRRIYADEKQLNKDLLWTVSILSAYFGDPEIAIDAMEKLKDNTKFYASDFSFMWYPIYHEVRQLPRFKEFVREIGFVDYWEQFGWPDLCKPNGDGDFVCD